jgi:hypothetical protein
MSVTIYSTLSAPVAYNIFVPKKNKNDLNKIAQKILIKGGANISDKNLYTPKGIVTHIEDEEFEILKDHPTFIRHEKAGFIKFDKGMKTNVDKAIKTLNRKDKSAPKTPEDYKEGKAPTVNKG